MNGLRSGVTVVVITRNRLPELTTALEHLRALPEQPKIIVVDNASSDGTPTETRKRFPNVEVVALDENLGSAGRNVGVLRTGTPYVAFSDDDSWWEPGALSKAVNVMDRYPRLGLLAARILVGPQDREDPVCAEMAASPLPGSPDLPGPPVLGFLACAAVVRRSAYLEAGGFEPRMLVGGEEQLLAVDLAAAGWGLAYVEDVVTHHYPSTVRDLGARRRTGIRNDLWFSWLRRPLSVSASRTLLTARAALSDADARAALATALRALPWALRKRRGLPPEVERDLRALDRGKDAHLPPG